MQINSFIMANNTFQAVTTIGYPESRILLSQCAVYLATSPKSNASLLSHRNSATISETNRRSSGSYSFTQRPTKLMKELGYGEEYKYAHDYNNNFDQEFTRST
jgi:putative ATPase